MDRNILHMDLDSFFVSVERILNPSLMGKPVIVGGDGDRGVVASCSYEARAKGVHAAMSSKMAKRLCPEAIFVSGMHRQYGYYSGLVTDIIRAEVPIYEKTSIDEFYIDLTGMDQYFGCYKIATELRKKIIKETNLPISFALSTNKTVAKIGTGEAKPNGQIHIPKGTEREFLAPLSVQKIPMVGEKTYQILQKMRIEKIKTIQEMSEEAMSRILGNSGISIWKKANGIDNSPVEAAGERKSISTECTFEQDTNDKDHLKRVLIAMTEKLGYQLRREEKLTSCVSIKLRYSDFNTYSMQEKIPLTALDHVLIEKVMEIFDQFLDPKSKVRLIGIRFSNLSVGSFQMQLFDENQEKTQLYQTMDMLKGKFGKGSIGLASSFGIKARDAFNPFKG